MMTLKNEKVQITSMSKSISGSKKVEDQPPQMPRDKTVAGKETVDLDRIRQLSLFSVSPALLEHTYLDSQDISSLAEDNGKEFSFLPYNPIVSAGKAYREQLSLSKVADISFKYTFMMATFGPHHGKFMASPSMQGGNITKRTMHQSTVCNARNNYQPPAVAVSSDDTQAKVQNPVKICIISKSTAMGEDKTHGFKDWTIRLPTSRTLFTVLRSPHIDKKSREQFEMRVKKNMVVMETDLNDLRKKFFWLKRQRMIGAQFEVVVSYSTRLDMWKRGASNALRLLGKK